MKAKKKRVNVRQRPTKSVKRGSYIPFEEQLRIIADYAAGGSDNSIRKLATKYNRDEDTISRIVKSPKVQNASQAMLNQLLEQTLRKVVERITYEVENKGTKDGAWMAMELATKFGAIPSGRETAPPPPEGNQDERTKAWIAKLTEAAMDRGKHFGMPMPEIEEETTEKTEVNK